MTKELTTDNWLPLLNYSTKHGVSLSTLRRRIKSNSIAFKLESGKYFLKEERQSPQTAAVAQTHQESHKPTLHHHESGLASSTFVEASVLSSANRLVEEIKAAYAKILQEKEEQIAQFKEEVADLRMLVRILEEGPHKKAPENLESSVSSYSGIELPKESSAGEDFSNDVFFGDFQNREI